jgi:hypothetical protein
MLRPMVANLHALRRAALGALIATAIGGAAAASDYIVVASNDPGFPRGRGLDSGQKLALAPGRSLTLMHASGDLMMLKGAAAGVSVPERKAQSVDAGRLEVLRTMVAPKPAELRTGLGARRGTRGVCPPPESLSSLDAIAAVQGPCPEAAERALEAYIAAHAPPET